MNLSNLLIKSLKITLNAVSAFFHEESKKKENKEKELGNIFRDVFVKWAAWLLMQFWAERAMKCGFSV